MAEGRRRHLRIAKPVSGERMDDGQEPRTMGWLLRLALWIGLVIMCLIWWWGLIDITKEIWEEVR